MNGLDVEEVRQLAKDLRAQAELINEILQRINRLLGATDVFWRGADAEQLTDRWLSEHAPTLRRLQEQLECLSRTAASNADDQERASSNGSMASMPNLGSVSLPDLLSATTTVTNVEINGIRPWDLVTSLAAAGEINGFTQMGKIGFVGDVVEVVGYADKIAKGEFDLLDGFDVAADVMQNYKGVGQLGGAAIHIWADAARAAMEVDWSASATSQTWDYMRDNPGAVAEEFGKATLQVGSKMLNYLGIP